MLLSGGQQQVPEEARGGPAAAGHPGHGAGLTEQRASQTAAAPPLRRWGLLKEPQDSNPPKKGTCNCTDYSKTP